jgi:uncharacterized protein YjbK
MSTNIEIEAKVLVNETDFSKLKTFLNLTDDQLVKQTNYYIDDLKGSLRNFGFALRIRELDKTYTLTLKSPMAEGTLEKNQRITKEAYLAFKNEFIFPKGIVLNFLEMFGFHTSDLRIITFLSTERIDTSYQGRHVCLDKNTYNGVTDYEVESEESSIKYAADTLKKLCEDVGISYQENHTSKYARALKSIK